MSFADARPGPANDGYVPRTPHPDIPPENILLIPIARIREVGIGTIFRIQCGDAPWAAFLLVAGTMFAVHEGIAGVITGNTTPQEAGHDRYPATNL